MNKTHLRLASVVRGLYSRVADKLGVDPSYVSRVARGERKSQKIEAALDREISKVLTIAAQRAKVTKKSQNS